MSGFCPCAADATDVLLYVPYSRIFSRDGALGVVGRGGIDGRTAQGRMVRALEARLVEHVGGNPTIAQVLLIERIVKMKLQLDGLGDKLETSEWTAHDMRTYGGLSNAYSRALRELDRMKHGKATTAPSLEEIMLRPPTPNSTGKAILWYNDIGGNFLVYCFTPSHEM